MSIICKKLRGIICKKHQKYLHSIVCQKYPIERHSIICPHFLKEMDSILCRKKSTEICNKNNICQKKQKKTKHIMSIISQKTRQYSRSIVCKKNYIVQYVKICKKTTQYNMKNCQKNDICRKYEKKLHSIVCQTHIGKLDDHFRLILLVYQFVHQKILHGPRLESNQYQERHSMLKM